MSQASPDVYPKALEREARLRDGTSIRIRPIRPDDAPRLIAFHARLSEDTRYQRFFSAMERLPPDWAHFFANVDYHRRLALVAEPIGAGDPTLIGVGRYDLAADGNTAEVAFVVEDRWQDKGIGRILLDDLLRAAQARGIRRFQAYVLVENERMLRLLERRTHVVARRNERGVVEIGFTAREDGPSPLTPAPGGGTAP